MPGRRRSLPLAATAIVVAGCALALGAPSSARGDAAPAWAWPVAPPHVVVRGFEAPAAVWAAGHRGIDVTAPVGAPVTAPADGRVTFAGRIVDRGVLAIGVGGGLVASFEPITASVATGQTVHRGEPVGIVSTGGTHAPGVLHIGARLNGAYVSPLLYLGGYRRPVLLPLSAADGVPSG